MRKEIFSRFYSVVVGVVVGSAFLVACSDSDNDDANGGSGKENITVNIPLPTTDQLEVKYSGKAVAVGADRADFNGCLVNRMTNFSGEIAEDAKAIIFTQPDKTQLSADELKKLIKAYSNNASIVICNPENAAARDGYAGKIADALEELDEQGVDVDAAYDLAYRIKSVASQNTPKMDNHLEAVAFRKNAIYVVRDLEEQSDSSAYHNSAYKKDEAGNETVNACPVEKTTPTAYNYGKSADMLVEWLQSADADVQKLEAHRTRATSGASSSIADLMSAQIVTVQECVGPSRALGKSMRYEMTYFIYSTHKFDSDEDYYFIRLVPNFHASELGCQTGDHDWTRTDSPVYFDDGKPYKPTSWYGPYMRKSIIEASVLTVGNEDVSLYDAKPTTSTEGSNSYTSGWSFSLGGNVGFNMAGPTGGISSSVGFSESRSHSEPNLNVVHQDYGKNYTQWTFEGIKPLTRFSFFRDNGHDLVANFQREDWSAEMTWIFVVKNPVKGHTYQLSVNDCTEIAELNHSLYDYELAVHPWQGNVIDLKQPNRAKDDFLMLCDNENLYDNVKSQLGDDWKSSFTYYAPTKEEVNAGVERMFNHVRSTIQGLADILQKQGYTGTYTFELRKKASPNAIASFTLKNGKVYDVK